MSALTLAEVQTRVGKEIGRSGLLEITQERIDAFADATGDHYWIHIDPERAGAGPFGATIAHGFLTLSLLPGLLSDCVFLADARTINYGLNRVRFPAPVRVGSRVFAIATLNGVEVEPDGLRATVGFEVRAEGAQKPAAAGEMVLRYYR